MTLRHRIPSQSLSALFDQQQASLENSAFRSFKRLGSDEVSAQKAETHRVMAKRMEGLGCSSLRRRVVRAEAEGRGCLLSS